MQQRSQKILVTGGAGYIGSHTVVSLLEYGYEPILLDDFRNAQEDVVDRLEQLCARKLVVERVDCSDFDAVDRVFQKHSFTGIIHFAAYKAVGESVENPLKYYHNNIGSMLVILRLMKKYEVKNLVFSSSCTVYGEPVNQIEVTEESPVQEATSPYGQTKIICERMLSDYHRAHQSSNMVALRYFNPIGAHPSALIGESPNGKPNNLLPYITQTAAGKLEKLTIFGENYQTPDGTCIRDYIHVCDLADAHVSALQFNVKQSTPSLEFVNVGTGKGTSVKELLQVFEKENQIKVNHQIGARRPGDVEAIYANTEKAKNLLNWQAKRSLEDSVRSAWLWEQNNNAYADKTT